MNNNDINYRKLLNKQNNFDNNQFGNYNSSYYKNSHHNNSNILNQLNKLLNKGNFNLYNIHIPILYNNIY